MDRQKLLDNLDQSLLQRLIVQGVLERPTWWSKEGLWRIKASNLLLKGDGRQWWITGYFDYVLEHWTGSLVEHWRHLDLEGLAARDKQLRITPKCDPRIRNPFKGGME